MAYQFMSKDKSHGGTILNIGSSCSMKPFLSSPIYTATKHAVMGLTKAYGVSEDNFKQNSCVFRFVQQSFQNAIIYLSLIEFIMFRVFSKNICSTFNLFIRNRKETGMNEIGPTICTYFVSCAFTYKLSG